MEAVVLNETAAYNLLESRLTTTQKNLNDFFIVISAILVFGNCNLIRLNVIIRCSFPVICLMFYAKIIENNYE